MAEELPPGLCAAVLENLPQRLAVINEAGRIVAVSGAWRAFALASGADLRATCEGADYLATCDATTEPGRRIALAVGRALREILAGDREEFVIEYPCHGPSPDQKAWFELHASGFTCHGRRFVMALHADRTRGAQAERKRTRAMRIAKRMRSLAGAYRMAVARLRRAQEAAGAVVFEMELDNCRIEGPDALRAIFGLPEDAAVDRPTLMAAVHPEDRPALEEALRRLAFTGGPLRHEFRVTAREGGTRWLQLHGATETGPGPAFRLAGVARDVTERREAEEALRRSERRHRALVEAGALITWLTDPSGALTSSSGWEALTGQSEAAMRGEGWAECVHPDDRAATLATWSAARAAGRPAEAEFRVLTRDGSWQWVRARAVPVRARPGDAAPIEWVGVLEDVDQRRRIEERRELLAREVDHRARNVLAVVQAVLRLSRSATAEAFAQAVEGRVAALARAHALLAEGSWIGANLRTVIEGEIEAYHTAAGPFAELSGPPLALSPAAAQALSMIFHELATNAAKYGALSRFEGHLFVTWRIDAARRCLLVRWRECGGPATMSPPTHRGFGSRVVESTVRSQLGGKMIRRWTGEGLLIEIELALDRVCAEG